MGGLSMLILMFMMAIGAGRQDKECSESRSED